MNEGELFGANFVFQSLWMTLMWALNVVLQNGSMVDFGWPSGFFVMAIAFFVVYPGWQLRKLLLCAMFWVCAARFMIGWWVFRKHWKREDGRWDLWRDRWRRGEGWFGIKNVAFNFFVFYHAQSMANIFILSIPLHIACSNMLPQLQLFEYAAVALWILAFWGENVADMQLASARSRNEKNAVVSEGLWRYSRHPNYFFEFVIWCSYAVFAIPSVTETWHYCALALVPVVAYYFLVFFTGIFITEASSVKKRVGYARYQETTNAFFPWFPRRVGRVCP